MFNLNNHHHNHVHGYDYDYWSSFDDGKIIMLFLAKFYPVPRFGRTYVSRDLQGKQISIPAAALTMSGIYNVHVMAYLL